MLLLPACCTAEKSAVLVIVDGLGSAYVYPGRSPACVDGTPLDGVRLSALDSASALYELWVPTTETESGNAVIATGYSGADEETVTYYNATIYDALRAEGYLSIAVFETGDTIKMVAEPDVVLYERNNSAYNPEAVIAVNSPSVPQDIVDLLKNDPPARLKAGSDHDTAYRLYDDWSLNKAIRIVRFMSQAHPGQRYLLVVSVAGTDMAAHEKGYDAYRNAVASLDDGLLSLSGACDDTGTAMVVTADHGMSFKSRSSRGSHASGEASMRNESRLVPLIIFNDEVAVTGRVFGQQCLAPTLLSLMECPDTLTVEDGEPLPVTNYPSLYLISDKPATAVLESPGFYKQVIINGTCRIGPVAAGTYKLTLPSGSKNIELNYDLTIRLADRVQGGLPAVSWLPYAGAAVVSAAGILVGLGLIKRR